MHAGLRNFPKALGQHVRNYGQRAGTALDKAIGTAHHYMKNVDATTMGVVGGALGQDAHKIARVIGGTKKSLASYEELRRGLVGDRA
jgi:hypothetical protein